MTNTNIIFENTRFDPDITPFHGLAKQMAQAFGYTADLALERKLAQLLRLRVAQINTCSYCLILHSKAARDQGLHPAKIDNLASWWESELYSAQEKAALKYCDVLTDANLGDFHDAHMAARAQFSEVEIAEMAAIIINMNLWTRLKLAQGAVPVFEDLHA